MLRNGAARALQEYVDDAESVRGTLTALRDGYCAELEMEAALAAALELEENGEVHHETPPPTMPYQPRLIYDMPDGSRQGIAHLPHNSFEHRMDGSCGMVDSAWLSSELALVITLVSLTLINLLWRYAWGRVCRKTW